MPEVHIPAETLWTSVTAIIVALLGSRLWDAISGRGKAKADAGLTDAQRQQLQDDIANGLRQDLQDADEHCARRLRMLEEQAERDRQECNRRLAALEKKLADTINWGEGLNKEACEARKAMQAEIDRLRERANNAEELAQGLRREMDEMVASMEAG